MSRVVLGVGLALLALGSACAPRARTQVMAVVTADAEVSAATERVRVRVVDQEGEEEQHDLGSDRQPVRFPFQIALVPAGGDATRTYSLEVAALDGAGAVVVARRVTSGFLPGRTMRLSLALEACCRGVVCTAEQSCTACACRALEVPAEHLESYDDDAGLPDAWSPSADAGSPDAAVPPDAPACAVNCFDVADFTGALNIAPPIDEDRRWAPPVGGCGGSVAPTADHGVRAFYLHNSGASALRVRLTTLREPPPDPSVDLALAVYDVPAAVPGWPLPADPRSCVAYDDDFPGLEPDAQLEHDIQPGATIQVIVTRETPGQILTPNVNIAVRPL